MTNQEEYKPQTLEAFFNLWLLISLTVAFVGLTIIVKHQHDKIIRLEDAINASFEATN